ncbi:MAG: tRNA lysidine(34) synthetase TilS [Oscillospiraceae bacterium]|nr:tRNA lysidine(34) synthetase TilS [Oscillospiraceae bacterium]
MTNKGLLDAVREFARGWDMLPSGGIVLCAVSGGADSMCLLHLLRALSESGGFSVAAAHFNHCLRGAASDSDEAFVRGWCAKQNISFYAGRGDAAAHARENGQSIEEAARELRYAFLEKTADAINAARIATAHSADDNAETVLLNLARGTSVDHAAIAPVRGRIIRPLLETTRTRVEEYLAQNGVPHVEDETNAQDFAARNRVRAHAMPALRSVNERAAENIARAAKTAQREGAFLDALAAKQLDAAEGEASVSREALRGAPEVLRARMVRLLLARLGTGLKDVSAAHIEDVVRLAASSRASGQLSLPDGVEAAVTRERLFLQKHAAPDGAVTLRDGQTVRWNGYRVRCGYIFPFFEKKGDTICICCDTIDVLPSLAPWDARSRMRLPDTRGARSVKRLFAERGIRPAQRGRTPCIYLGGTLAAVYGIGTAEAFLPQSGKGAWEIEIFDESQQKWEENDYEAQ